jgi:hypothetical protein
MKKEKALKIIYELIIHHEELINEEDKDCWKAYEYIKEKIESKGE